eukprot:jgi/Galph1/1798/GphlegSOOS_G497.1
MLLHSVCVLQVPCFSEYASSCRKNIKTMHCRKCCYICQCSLRLSSWKYQHWHQKSGWLSVDPKLHALSTFAHTFCLNKVRVGKNTTDITANANKGDKEKYFVFGNTVSNFTPLARYNQQLWELCKNDEISLAFEVLKEMGEKDVEPDSFTYHCFVRYFANKGDERTARYYIRLMLEKDIQPLTKSVNILLRQYFVKSSRAVEKASLLFERMKEKQVPLDYSTYNSLLHVFALNGEIIDSMERKGISPDIYSFCIVGESLCRNGRWQEAVSLRERMRHIPLDKMTHYYNVLLRGCKLDKPRDLCKAFALIEDMKKEGVTPNSLTFLMLLDISSELNDMDGTRRVIHEIINIRTKTIPVEAMNAALSLFCRMKAPVDETISLFYRAKENGLTPDLGTYNILMEHAFRKGNWQKGGEIFKELSMSDIKPDETTYNCLIRGYSYSAQYQKMIAAYLEMRKRNMTPNEQSCSDLIRVFHRQGNVSAARQVLMIMESCYSPRHDLARLAFVRAYVALGRLEDATKIKVSIQDMGKLRETAITVLMDGFASVGNVSKVEELVRELKLLRKGPIDIYQMGIYIKALCNSKQHRRAFDLLLKEERKEVVWYNTIVHSLAKTEDKALLFEILQYMQVSGEL